MHLRHNVFRSGRPRHRLRTRSAAAELVAVRDRLVVVVQRLTGVLLTDDEVRYLVDLVDQVVRRGVQPNARAADLIRRLRKSCADASARVQNPHAAPQHARYDLVDTREAAALLGISESGVRDLIRRGKLPGHRAAGRWLVPAASVVERAERKAARQG
jgi:excisionase family DNA binding protein